MSLKERFKIYILGAIAGIFLVTLFFGNRSSCKDSIVNYFPEGRVKQEILFYDIDYAPEVSSTLKKLNISDSLFKVYIDKSDVDFGLSDQRAKPCGKYVLFSKDSIQKLEIHLDKCKGRVFIENIQVRSLNE